MWQRVWVGWCVQEKPLTGIWLETCSPRHCAAAYWHWDASDARSAEAPSAPADTCCSVALVHNWPDILKQPIFNWYWAQKRTRLGSRHRLASQLCTHTPSSYDCYCLLLYVGVVSQCCAVWTYLPRVIAWNWAQM